MRIYLRILALVALFAAVDAQAWCVKCEVYDCWMVFNENAAVTCYKIGNYGCMTSGFCPAGQEGCPEGPDGCVAQPGVRRDAPCAGETMLAESWRLEAVEVKSAPKVEVLAQRGAV